MMSKQAVYISLFTLLGVLISFLLHAAIEIPVIEVLITDFETYNLGLSWQQWYLLHHIFSVLLLFAGIALGFQQGVYWWKRLYEKTHARE